MLDHINRARGLITTYQNICTYYNLFQVNTQLVNYYDLIPSFLVRDSRPVLAKSIASLINLSIRTSIFPKRWKIARISPVFKKGKNSDVSNYRPISILSSFAKIYEHLLYCNIYSNIRIFRLSSMGLLVDTLLPQIWQQ